MSKAAASCQNHLRQRVVELDPVGPIGSVSLQTYRRGKMFRKKNPIRRIVNKNGRLLYFQLVFHTSFFGDNLIERPRR